MTTSICLIREVNNLKNTMIMRPILWLPQSFIQETCRSLSKVVKRTKNTTLRSTFIWLPIVAIHSWTTMKWDNYFSNSTIIKCETKTWCRHPPKLLISDLHKRLSTLTWKDTELDSKWLPTSSLRSACTKIRILWLLLNSTCLRRPWFDR